MKRVLSVLLAVMLLCGTACAEGFTMRNGLAWGMSQDTARAVLGEENDDESKSGMTWLRYNDLPVSRYHGRAMFGFMANELKLVIYGIENEDEEVKTYLQGALTVLYGEPQPLVREPLIAFVESIDMGSGFEPEEEGYHWRLKDAEIWLFMVEHAQFILYRDPSFAPANMVDGFDVTGL